MLLKQYPELMKAAFDAKHFNGNTPDLETISVYVSGGMLYVETVAIENRELVLCLTQVGDDYLYGSGAGLPTANLFISGDQGVSSMWLSTTEY